MGGAGGPGRWCALVIVDSCVALKTLACADNQGVERWFFLCSFQAMPAVQVNKLSRMSRQALLSLAFLAEVFCILTMSLGPSLATV